MAKYYNKLQRSIEVFKRGELVMLNRKNIRSKGQCEKLDDKMYGPVKILSTGHNNQEPELELPGFWESHHPFYIAWLERCRGNNQERTVIKVEADDTGW
jgi:hypothetical protein